MRFVRTFGLLLLVAGALLGIALWTCPAELAYRLLGARLAPLALRGLSGTIWHGHAASVDVFGHDAGTLDWTLAVEPLLRGEAVVQFVLNGDFATAHGTLHGASARAELGDVEIVMPAANAAPVFAIPALEPRGTIAIDIAHARLQGGWLADAAGVATWRNAAVAGAAQAQLGDLQATFAAAADGTISGAVRDLGGPLELAGTFSASLGRYEAIARLAARTDNAQVNEALQYVGQPNADGSRNLEIRGHALGLLAPPAE